MFYRTQKPSPAPAVSAASQAALRAAMSNVTVLPGADGRRDYCIVEGFDCCAVPWLHSNLRFNVKVVIMCFTSWVFVQNTVSFWLGSVLDGKQAVYIANNGQLQGKLMPATSSVPQGYIMGTISFLNYMNDLITQIAYIHWCFLMSILACGLRQMVHIWTKTRLRSCCSH